MTFNEKYKNIKNYANKELSIIENKIISCIETREPLNSHLKNFLSAPSKRIRSVLSILYTKALSQTINEKQLELLCAIELIHNASLIHDDIIDESILRRGEQTTRELFDNKIAVISGDYILSLAMEKIISLNNHEILNKIIFTINQMCLGEINQNFDRFKIGTIENYIEKSKKKTGYLFETALACSAILIPERINGEKISNFGLNTGIAFQIRDDLLNLTSNDPSKPSKNDIAEGIYNAPVIYAQNPENYTSGIEKTKDLLNNYIEKAKYQISDLPENIYKKQLYCFLELLKEE